MDSSNDLRESALNRAVRQVMDGTEMAAHMRLTLNPVHQCCGHGFST